MDRTDLIQINLDKVLKDKLGDKSRYVPAFAVRRLEKILCCEQLNALLRHNYPHTGAEFCDGVLSDLNVTAEITNPHALPPLENKRVVIVCNHPLGGLDGMALISALTRVYGPGLRVVVNDILMAVKPLSDVFLPINKHGRQDRGAVGDINSVLTGDDPVLVFPAGLVSRRGRDGRICDLRWNKMFVNKAAEYHRDVLPIFFSGENSAFFYKFAQWRKRLGIKFNIEMVLLPGEIFKSEGKRFDITIGALIPWQQLRTGSEAGAQAQEVKEMVYALKKT